MEAQGELEAGQPWYCRFFNGIALDLWRQAIRLEMTREEAEFLFTELRCAAGSRVLDVPCGNGRHALELARRGCVVIGVDIAEEFIAEARQRAKEDGLRIDFRVGDMSCPELEGGFDGAYCFGNSFGYFPKAKIQSFLAGVSRVMKKGALFIIDSGLAAESILPHVKERDWYQVGDILFASEHIYHPATSCLETNYTFIREGRSETRKAFYWIFTVAEIGRMLEAAGFRPVRHFSSTGRAAYALGSRRLLLVAEKV